MRRLFTQRFTSSSVEFLPYVMEAVPAVLGSKYFILLQTLHVTTDHSLSFGMTSQDSRSKRPKKPAKQASQI